jgi:hypothetical protein
MKRPDAVEPLLYDRELLLNGEKRNAVLDLWEVQRYGTDSYGDADYVSIYGLQPTDWYAKGIRLLGRTAVELTRDVLGHPIGKDVAEVIAKARHTAGVVMVDPFAGSGNTLYWLLRHLPGARGVGFELDQGVFRLTRQNLGILALPIEVLNVDYRAGLADVSLTADQLVVAFIAPPWGDALDPVHGLNLRRTTPPIAEVVEFLIHVFPNNRLLCAIQLYERVEAGSLADLQTRFDWSALRVYDLNAPGENHGILLGARGWVP